MLKPRNIRSSHILAPVFILILALGVACGSASAPETIIEERIVEKEVIKEVIKEVEKEVVVEVEKLVVATPTPAPVPKGAARRDELTILTASFGNEIFDPRYISSDKSLWWEHMQAVMIASNKDLELTTDGIVTKWALTDNNRGWEYTIRDDAFFHNGDPVTAEDVAFSIQRGFHEDAVSRVRSRIVKIIEENAHTTGPNTVKILLAQPLSSLPPYMSENVASGGSSGVVMSKSHWEDVGGAEGYEANPNPGAAGPFNMIVHLRSEEVILERWPDYFRKDRQYAFDRLSVRLVPEQSTQMAALQAGVADIVPADLTTLDQIEKAGAHVVFGPQSTVIWINANSCSPEQPPQAGGAGLGLDLKGRPLACSDRRVRYALDYAIDKTLIQKFYGGPEVFAIKGTAAVSPAGLGYGPGLDPFPYDPDKARALFAEAGFPDGKGFYYDEPFQVWTWPAGATAPRIVDLAELICSMWEKELNFECEVNVGEEVSVKEKQYSGSIPGEYLVRANEHDYDVGSKYKGRFGTPESSYISYDSSLQAIIDEGLAKVVASERADAYYKMHTAVHEAHYDFAPGYLNAPYGVTNEITEWEPWPLRISPSALWTIRYK